MSLLGKKGVTHFLATRGFYISAWNIFVQGAQAQLHFLRLVYQQANVSKHVFSTTLLLLPFPA